MAKQRRYSDDFRANAVLMLEAAGYPDQEGALSRVAAHLGVPHQTLSRWARGINNPPPHELVQEKKAAFIEQLRAIRGMVADQITERIEEFEPRDLTGLLKISAELVQLLSGEPTARTEHRGEIDVAVTDARERLARKLDSVASRVGTPRDSGLLN